MEVTLYEVGVPDNSSFLLGLDTNGDVYRYPMTAFFAPTLQSLASTVLSATNAATTATNAAGSVSDAIAAAISNLTGDLATDVSNAAASALAAYNSATAAAGTLSTLEAGITAAVSSAVSSAVAPMLSTVSGLHSASTKNVGTSVNDPGTLTLETLLPIQTVTGTNKTYLQADLFLETRRSNSGTAMGDTFPGSSTTGLTNGTMMQINNVDTTALLTITAGAGTTMSGGNTTAIVGPGRSTKWVYDAGNTTWRATMNSLTSTLLVNMHAYSTNTSTSSSTSLTAANIYGGSVEHTLNLTGAISAASNAQLPTVSALMTQMGNVPVGETYKLRVINGGGTGLGVWMITTNTNWTIYGNVIIPPNTWQDYYITFTSSTAATLQAISTVPILAQHAYSTNSSTSSTNSLSAANIFGGSIEHVLNLTGAITTASNAQLPSVATLVAAMPNAQIGQTYKLRIINGGGTGSGVWTVTQSSGGWTLNNTMTIPASLGYRDFYVTLTSLTAGTLQSLGTGTIGAI